MRLSGAVTWDALLLVFFVICLFEAFTIPKGLTLGMALKEVGSALWPQILLVALVVLAAIQLRADLQARAEPGDKEKPKPLRPGGIVKVGGFALLSAAYIVGQRVVGFPVACFCLVAGTLGLMGYKNKALLLVASVVIAALFAAMFGRMLFTPLPKGLGFFRTISSLVY